MRKIVHPQIVYYLWMNGVLMKSSSTKKPLSVEERGLLSLSGRAFGGEVHPDMVCYFPLISLALATAGMM